MVTGWPRAKTGYDYLQFFQKFLWGAISDTELYYMLEFARTHPILRAPVKLSWSQIESLLAINEDEKREELIKRARAVRG